MRIILSPAKKMNENQDIMEPFGIPEYVNQTEKSIIAKVYSVTFQRIVNARLQ